MARQKGTPKTGGKTKGTPNKKTQEAVKRVEWVLSLLEPTLDADIESIKPSERVQLWNDLQEYIRPKLARTVVTQEGVQQIEVIVKRK